MLEIVGIDSALGTVHSDTLGYGEKHVSISGHWFGRRLFGYHWRMLWIDYGGGYIITLCPLLDMNLPN